MSMRIRPICKSLHTYIHGIKPNQNIWAPPVLTGIKKGNSMRMRIDHQALHRSTAETSIQKILDSLKGASMLSTDWYTDAQNANVTRQVRLTTATALVLSIRSNTWYDGRVWMLYMTPGNLKRISIHAGTSRTSLSRSAAEDQDKTVQTSCRRPEEGHADKLHQTRNISCRQAAGDKYKFTQTSCRRTRRALLRMAAHRGDIEYQKQTRADTPFEAGVAALDMYCCGIVSPTIAAGRTQEETLNLICLLT
jgi:hypothetical protein